VVPEAGKKPRQGGEEVRRADTVRGAFINQAPWEPFKRYHMDRAENLNWAAEKFQTVYSC